MIRKPPTALTLIAATMFMLTAQIAATDPADNSTAAASGLIQQLGSANFETREAAMHELARRGESIRPELEAALRDADLEIRMRARKLLAGMSRADLQRRLAAFVEDTEGLQEHDLPGWKKYESLLGDGPGSRKLFAEMVSREFDLLTAYQRDRNRIAESLAGRIQAFETGFIPGLAQQASAASVATLLFVASDDGVPLTTTLGYQVYRFLNLSAAHKAIEESVHSPLVKKLLVAWIERGASNSSLARSGLMLAESYKMNDTALSLARNLVLRKDSASYTLPYALLSIGRFGGKQDVAPLERLLTNKAVCHTWHNGKFEQPIQVQVRDVALAVLVHLTKQDHKQYGFDLLRPDPRGLYYVYTMGFAEDAQRDQALARWREWSAERAG